jgi:hypothetical protein
VAFGHDEHARKATDSLRVPSALAEKQGSRKEIAGTRHEKLPAVTFMQQFYYSAVPLGSYGFVHFIHDSDSAPR